MSITYSESVFVALGIQHEIRRIIICGLSGSTIFVQNYLIKGKFSEGKKVTEHEMYFDFVYSFCLKHFSF